MKTAVNNPNLIQNKYGIWISSFTDPAGIRVRRSLRTRDIKLAAMKVSKMMIEAYEKGHFDLKRPVRKHFSELADKVLVYAKDKTKRYKKVYLPTIKTLMKHLNGKMLCEITKGVVLDVQTQIKQDVSEVNSNNAMVVLKRMFNLAIEWEYIDANPVKGIKLYRVQKRKVRPLEAEEKEKLLSFCPGYMKEIVLVALHSGMRKSEILGLKWDNVDLFRKLVILDKTKSNRIREIPMSSDVYNLLFVKYQEKKLAREDYVFPNADNEPYRDVAAFRKAAKLAGVQCRFHDLRHDFGSQLVSKGVDLNTVRELLGHAQLDTTQIYLHLAPNQKRDAIAKLENHPAEDIDLKSNQSKDPQSSTALHGRVLAE